MEEQILKIIEINFKNWDESNITQKAAKEITSHILEFIEWYTGYNSNIKEDYQYWLTIKQ